VLHVGAGGSSALHVGADGSSALHVGVAGPSAEPVVDTAASEPLKRVAIHLELDLDAGRLTVAIEHGPTARIVRDVDGWRVEIP
jgi:hypothetical protein